MVALAYVACNLADLSSSQCIDKNNFIAGIQVLDKDDPSMRLYRLWKGAHVSTGIRGVHPGALAAYIFKVAFNAQASNT